MLKTIFPLSFGTNDVSKLVIKILLYLAASIVVGFVLNLFGWIPIIGAILWLIGSLLNLYFLAGIVITVLNFTKIIE